MRRAACVAGVLVLLASTAFCAESFRLERDRFEIDAGHSAVEFDVEFMGLTRVDGRFKRFWGTILYNPEDVTRSSVSVAIRTDSIDTANNMRDADLKSARFFDAEKFPFITFQSRTVEKDGEGFVARGPLTLRGVTRQIALPFRMVHGPTKDMWENVRVGFEGTMKLDRRDFGLVGPSAWNRILEPGRLTIGNEVNIRLRIQGLILNMDKITLPASSVAHALWETFSADGWEPAEKQYRTWKNSPPADLKLGESSMNLLGYKLLYRHKIAEALEVFRWNAEAHPESANVYDSLGDAYVMRGDTKQAVENYQKALQKDPNDTNAIELLRKYAGGK